LSSLTLLDDFASLRETILAREAQSRRVSESDSSDPTCPVKPEGVSNENLNPHIHARPARVLARRHRGARATGADESTGQTSRRFFRQGDRIACARHYG